MKIKHRKYLIPTIIITFSFLFIQSKHVNKLNEEPIKIITDNNSEWVDSLMKTMTPDERLGQLFMIPAYPNQGNSNKELITQYIQKYHIGGLIMFKSGPVLQAKQTNYYQSISKIPLMIAGDYEWGLSMRMDSTVKYPHQMMLGAIQNDLLINEFGEEIARQCNRMGIHINFAPVIDINNNSDNPVINSRSFGEIKENVTSKGLAYMVGMQTHNVLAVGKHFPGHGDTDVDSHKDLPIILHTKERIDSLELYPFKVLIKTGLGGIMAAHLNIPALDSGENAVSSLSYPILTELLKNKLGFKGLIFTDALGMKGVTKHYQAGETELKALQAGVDVLLMPENLPIAFEYIKTALKKGKITQKEIDEHCRKILIVKKWFGLNKYKPIKIENLYKDLNSEYAVFLKSKLTEAALTLAVNNNQIIPFENLDKTSIAAVSIDNLRENEFQKTLKLYTDIETFNIPKNTEINGFNKYIESLSKFNTVIVSIHEMSRNPKSFGITKNTIDFVDKLSEKTQVVLVLFGNPYALQLFNNPQNIKAVLVSYNDELITQNLSAQALFGGITVDGKLPVSAGNLFKSGNGKVSMKQRLKYASPFELNLDSDSLLKIDSIIENAVIQKATPGATVLAARNGKIFFYKSYGYHTYKKINKTQNSDIYDLASITKIASTLPVIMKLVETGKININKPLSTYMPALKNTNKENILIRDILAHQAKLIPWIPFYKDTYEDETLTSLSKSIYSSVSKPGFQTQVADKLYILDSYKDTIYQKIYDSELRNSDSYKYSDLGFMLFHKMIEDITGQKQDEYVSEHFYKKLGATTLGYLPLNRFNKSEILPTEDDTFFRNQTVQAYVHDFAAAMTGGVNGHAGLFSNANDLAKLAQMYLDGGKYGKERYFSNETIKRFSSCAFCENNNRRGLGFDRPMKNGGPASHYASKNSYGHSGFTGTLVWIDPKYDFIYIFLSNRTYPDSENNVLLKTDVRTKVQDYFYKSFPDLDTTEIIP